MRDIVNIGVGHIHPHPENPRKDLGDLTELAESIKKNGVMQNLTVIPQEGNPGEYTAIIGHRRHAAAVLAGITELPCRIIEGMSEKELAKVRNTKIGFVFQDFMLLDGLTIRENILVPRIVQGAVDKEVEKMADQLASMFGIGHILNKYPAEISGGEKQRAAVARSLINVPLIILADEPTGNLDSKSSRAVIETFINAKQKMNATIFMVTHDSFAASFCDRVILLKDGTIYRQLEKTKERGEFQDQLLDTIKQMSE